MANESQQKPAPRPEDAERLIGGEFWAFAEEDREDRRNWWIATIIAVVFHVGLGFIVFPEFQTAESAQAQQKVYVVQQVRFKPPPPKQQQELPQPKSKKVPIPDPTPDEPEPIRLDEEPPEIDVPDTDIIFDIPEGPPSREPEGPIRVGGDVLRPEKISGPDPQYTEIARKARIQGVVILEAIIDKEGYVQNVKVLKSLPMGLDQAAVEAVRTWRFRPATLNGRPVDVYYNLTVNFRLQ